jgi:hypothetical protein
MRYLFVEVKDKNLTVREKLQFYCIPSAFGRSQ